MTHKTGPMLAAAFAGSLAVLCSPSAARASTADYVTDAKRLSAAGDLAAARLQLRNAIKQDGGNADAHYQLGMVDLQIGDPVAAEKEARAALDRGYDAVSAQSLLWQAYLNQGHYKEVLHDFPPDQGAPALQATILVGRGRALMLLDRVDEAAAAMAQAATLAPRAAAPLLGQAQLAIRRGDRATAMQKVAAALALEPESSEALQQQASLLAETGDQAGAIAAANKAVTVAPGQVAPRLERAGVMLSFSRLEEAQADVDVVLSLTPGNARAIYYRAVLEVRAGNFPAANGDLDKLSLFISQYPPGYLLQAFVKQQVGQIEQALDAATRYNARVPDDPRGVTTLASLQLQANKPDLALATLTPTATAGSGSSAIYDLRGSALAALGRQAEAVADFDRALALAPNDPALLARAGGAKLALGEAEAALPLLQRAAQLSPTAGRVSVLLASALIDTAQFDAAQKVIARIKAQPDGAGPAQILSGALHLAAFDLPAARDDFTAVLHDHPDAIDARIGLARTALLEGHAEEWATRLGEVLQREPARLAVVGELTDYLVRQNKIADAIAVLERAHAAVPADAQPMTRLANLYLRDENPQKALALATSPVAGANAGPAPLPWLVVQAQAQLALKQPDAAIATYRQILAANPRLVGVRAALIQLMHSTNDIAGARQELDQALAADPQSMDLLRAAVDLDAKPGDLPAALASAAKLDQDPAHRPASRSLRGDLYLAAKKYDDAVAAYDEPMKAEPSSILALRLAVAQIAAGHRDAAAEGLRAWLARTPGDEPAMQMLSDIALQTGHLPQARALLSDLLAKHPGNAVLLNNLAWVEQQGNDKQAIDAARRAYRLAPTPQTADTLGYIMATEGEGDHGVALLRMASLQAADPLAVKYHLAVAYKAAGHPDEAVKVLTPLLAEPADFSEKPQAKQLLADLVSKR